jgi:hypothetical protein
MVVGLVFLIILGENEFFMYRNVLLTDKEIALLKTIISQTLHEKVSVDRNNLTIIHNRLREIKPINNYNQTVNYGKWE